MALDPSLAGTSTAPASFSYTWKDVVLYALGIGAKRDELDYLYEGNGGPKVYPSFAVVSKFPPLLDLLGRLGGDLGMLVHTGEKVVVHGPFAPSGTLTTVATVRGVYDMRRFAQVVLDTESRDEKGALVASTTSAMLFRGEGGFGGAPPPKEEGVPVPKDREADFTVEEATSPEQALLYRLSGDPNPLHADPAFARSVGFERGPILHGLATFGHMVRHFAKGAVGGDAGRIASIEGQFKRPVWPGDTLVTQGWDVGGGKFALQVRVKERSEVVLGGAWGQIR
jgi:acyl dehydratase